MRLIKYFKPVLYAVLDALVIGRLEMEAGNFTDAPPVPAVEPPAAHQEKAHGKGLPVVTGDGNQETLTQPICQGGKETSVQRRVIAIGVKCAGVAMMDQVEIRS